MIPEGWTEKSLDEFISDISAGVSANCDNRPAEANEIGILKTSAVSYGIFDPTENKAVLPTEVDRVSVYPTKDTIVFCRSNTPELVGASAYIEHDFENLFLPDTLWRLSPRDRHVSMQWLSYLLNTSEARQKLQNIASGTSANMKKISMRSLLKLAFFCPPLPEQRAIAAILSTWDEAITLTERLIAVLQTRKRGLMQRLLTGEVRFPEFEGEWVEVRLGDVFSERKERGFADLSLLSVTEAGIVIRRTQWSLFPLSRQQ